jgi:glutaredoxin
MAEVTFYGADWCSDCRRSKSLLNTLGVEYEMKDVEQSADLAAEAEAVAGIKKIPVLVIADVEFMVEPSDADLHAALTKRDLI